MKRKFLAPLIVIVFLVGIVGCAGMVTNVPDIPESQGLMYMETWYDLKATYNREIAMPNLSEEFKDVLDFKREALIGLKYAIQMYNEYIDDGHISAQTLDDIYTKYINIAEIPFADLAYIYEQYMKTNELDFVMLENIIDIIIAEITARALTNLM